MTTIHATPTISTQPLVAFSTDAVRTEEQEQVLPGDLREARHHQHVGSDDRPTAQPAGARPERLVAQVNVVPQSGSRRLSSR